MNEIATYPVVQRLIAELCELEPGDEVMPLAIIVNLHKAQLRAPFEGIVRLVSRHRDEDPEDAILIHYPYMKGMLGGSRLEDLWSDAHDDMSVDEILEDAPRLPRGAKSLMRKANAAWVNYDAGIALHHLTWTHANLLAQAALLNELLRQQPGGYEMLLDVRRYTTGRR